MYFNDARTINPDELPDIDLICGGFPCQSFSVAGKRKGFDDTSEIIIDNTQLTIFGGFAPNSSSADTLSKALGSRTVMSGSVNRGKDNPSESLQMIERPLMTPDELKSLPKGTFVVMKTGVYPMKVKLKLFFKWGIEFEENYVVPEQVDRQIEYATKDEIISGIGNKYKSMAKTKKKDRPFPSASHHANEQKQMHHSEHEEKTDDLESPTNRPKPQVVTNINKNKETVEKVQQRYEEQVFAEGINKQ